MATIIIKESFHKHKFDRLSVQCRARYESSTETET